MSEVYRLGLIKILVSVGVDVSKSNMCWCLMSVIVDDTCWFSAGGFLPGTFVFQILILFYPTLGALFGKHKHRTAQSNLISRPAAIQNIMIYTIDTT